MPAGCLSWQRSLFQKERHVVSNVAFFFISAYLICELLCGFHSFLSCFLFFGDHSFVICDRIKVR